MEASKIQWTDNTFNPWMGCQKVSPGCEHCYAEALVTGRMGLPIWGPPKTTNRQRTSAENWKKPLAWNRRAQKTGKREKVFCASLADVFEDNAQLMPWREDLFNLIEQCTHLDWQLLTKRPENIFRLTRPSWFIDWPSHVWIGCTVENQEQASKRYGYLAKIPARVRYFSMEPLLEHVDLTRVSVKTLPDGKTQTASNILTGTFASTISGEWQEHKDIELFPAINWVIVGGESGSDSRPFDLQWARSIVDQCRTANVPVFVKQMGELPIDSSKIDVVNPQGKVSYVRDHGSKDHLEFIEQVKKHHAYSIRPHRPKFEGKGGEMQYWPKELQIRQFPGVAA